MKRFIRLKNLQFDKAAMGFAGIFNWKVSCRLQWKWTCFQSWWSQYFFISLFFHLQIRGVEIGIVVLVLMVWAGAIGLFFNRWGKIRMLLPYQPDYKQDQLKVPGTTACPPGQCNGHQHQVISILGNWSLFLRFIY